jgi:uncharacterized repeat protein (TIGR03803 family)
VVAVLQWAAHGQLHFERLKSFGDLQTSGNNPVGPLCLGSDHWLYGATYSGGSSDQGTAFKVRQDGSGYMVLHHFGEGTDGRTPDAGLIEASNGFLYGTTRYGGTNGGGCVFRLSRDGATYQIVRNLGATDGGNSPNSPLVEGPDNADYGTTEFGGTGGGGTIFRIALADHTFSILRSFRNNLTDGRIPSGSLILGSDGLLYGTTRYGGNYDRGIVFKVNLDGSGYAVLRRFSWADGRGSFPNGLIESTNGLLYGTTSYGGTFGFGTIFQLGRTGENDSDIHNFTASGPRRPWAPVLEGDDGVLYGTTLEGGAHGRGTAYKIDKSNGTLTVIHDFPPPLWTTDKACSSH